MQGIIDEIWEGLEDLRNRRKANVDKIRVGPIYWAKLKVIAKDLPVTLSPLFMPVDSLFGIPVSLDLDVESYEFDYERKSKDAR